MALAHHARWLGVRKAHRTTPDIGSDENAVSAARRASARKLQLELSIAPDGILDLCRLGWLDPDTAQDPRSCRRFGDGVDQRCALAALAAQYVRLKTWPTLHRRLRPVEIGGTDHQSRDGAIIAPLHRRSRRRSVGASLPAKRCLRSAVTPTCPTMMPSTRR